MDCVVAVVAHHSRARQAEALASALRATVFLDEGHHGAFWNHRRVLEWAAEQGQRVLVLEDDALPVPGFMAKAASWMDRYPDDLVSFYLGTSRPKGWQRRIETAVRLADEAGRDFITFRRLLFGVAYTIPAGPLPRLLDELREGAADQAIGRAWDTATGRPVIYPTWSLVDHADTGSVERHPDGQPRTEPRKARRLAQ